MFPCPTFKVLSLMVLFYLCIGRTYLLVLNIYFVVLFIHWYRAARCDNRFT